MKFRIKKYKLGYVVEVQKFRNYFFYKKEYWEHYISVAGIDYLPWYHMTKEMAMMSLLDKIKWNTIANSSFIIYP